ncbi:hypothetical protein SAY87_018629 [Trapa incisa]|uniref:Protein kinase domain-containing protein n=1 Tax=Trapa incisa TaxID=236973 RepID=A0AAN7K4E3_9MYRT|nr:hypothetical protein SAY87_018629 [Trapa incisa]
MRIALIAESSLLLILLLGCLSGHDAQQAAPPNPVCQTSCGRVPIPYPFGIGHKDCFLNEWYEIFCQPDTPIPMMKKSNLEVKSISLPDQNKIEPVQATIRVTLPVKYSSESCTHINGTSLVLPSLAGSPFVYSVGENVLLAYGCNFLAVASQAELVIAGCNSTCKQQGSFRSFDYCFAERCCSSPLGEFVLQELSISVGKEGMPKPGQDEDCGRALLMDKSMSYDAASGSHSQEFVIGVLEWGIPGNTDLAANISKSCPSCQTISDGPFPDGIVRFSCRKGYTGNPYTIGCKDINECNNPESVCTEVCLNYDGGFECKKAGETLKFIDIGLGAGLGLVICLVLLHWSYVKVKKRKEGILKEMMFKRNGGTVLQQRLTLNECNPETTKLFRVEELQKATDGFSDCRIIGKGGQGTVYKGMLYDGRIVAVKKFGFIEERKVEQFINEVLILSHINHRNVVKLLGFCLETDVPYLVYEFIPNGTLYSYLHEPNERFFIAWEVRLRLATEVAEALSYLHSAASVPIYHRDIKSTNILLDEKYQAKVADFGSSKYVPLNRTHMTTLVQGTFGYLDPEYFQSCQLTDKSDVYSFGVVLVELLTGQKPISPLRVEEGVGLAAYFTITMEENRLFDILDSRMLQQAEKEQIMAVANLAKRCVLLNGRNRPTMKEVAILLEGIRKPKLPPPSSGDIHPNEELNGCLSVDHTSEASQMSSDFLTSTCSQVFVNVTSMTDVEPLLCARTW